MKIITCLSAILLLIGCQQTNEDIVSVRKWKASDGYNLGDMITFSGNKTGGLYISNDTIYRDGRPEALVVSTEYNIDHYVLTLHSIDHKQTGKYIDKGRAE